MARTRSIKPGFFDNDVLGDLSPLTRLLFIGLWVIADREGRLEDRPRKIKKAIMGYDDVDADGVDAMLQSLEDNGFITRYEADGNRYIQVINFVKHQNPHIKEKASEIPPPACGTDLPHEYWEESGQDEQSTGLAPDKHHASTEEAAPITVNPLPITGTPSPSTAEDLEGACNGGGEKPADKPQNLMERRFELFWKAYPKKKAKNAARSAFKKAKPDEALFNCIMEAIGRARTSTEWQREGGRYIPNPATWLNGGCWDDEIEEVNTNGGAGRNSEYHGRNDGGQQAPAPATGTKPNAISGFKSADDE